MSQRRSSVAIVEEARGTPYKIISWVLALFMVGFGVRGIFFCESLLPWEDESAREAFRSMWPECKTNPAHGVAMGCAGALGIVHGGLRVNVATSKHLADFFQSIRAVSVINTIVLWLLVRDGYHPEHPIFYQVLLAFELVYEIYVTLAARKALKLRRDAEPTKQAELDKVNETRGIAMKAFYLVVGAVFILNGLRFIFACDYTFPFESSGMADFLEEAWPDCKTNMWTRFSSGLNGTWSIVHAATKIHIGLAEHISDLYSALLVQVFLDSLMLFFMVRAGPDFFQPIHKVLAACGIAFEIYKFTEARRAHLALLAEKEEKAKVS